MRPGNQRDGSEKQNSVNTFISPILVICLVPVIYYLFRGGVLLQELTGGFDRGGLVIGLLLFLISAFIFCTGIATCINSFYLSPNLNNLLVMPYTPAQITGAKFIVAALYEYTVSFAVLAPVLFGYGFAMEAPAVFWAGEVLAVLLLPVVPLAYAAVISMIIMRFIGAAKNKERMTAIGSVGVFLFLIIYEIIQEATKGINIRSMGDAIDHLAKTLKGFTGIFPEIPFFVRIMEKGQLSAVLWCFLAVIVILLLFFIAARFLYLAGAVGIQAASASHRKLSDRQMQKLNRNNNIVRSYTHKELRTILRTPAYYMNCLFLTLGWPLVLIFPALFSKAEKNNIYGLEKLLLQPESDIYFIFVLFVVVFAVTVFSSTLNGTAPTSISREGKNFMIMKQLPIPYRKQLRAKQNAALVICGAGSGGYLIIGEIYMILFKGLNWWSVFPTVLFNLLLLYIIVDLEMICGLMKPNLSWESEGDVSSKNVMGFVLFLLGIIVGCTLVFGLNHWVRNLECRPWIFLTGILSILFVLAFLLNRIFYLYGERRLERL